MLINEFEQNPPGTDTGYEWVELLNPTSNVVDIGGWTLSTTHGVNVTLMIPDGTTIGPYEYQVYTYSKQWLDNEDESVILRDAAGNVIDETPISSDGYNDDRAWARYPNGLDTDSAHDWSFQTATPGYSNGVKAPPATAKFEVSDLMISPTEVGISEEATVSVSVRNVGEVKGACTVVLKINDVVEASKDVTLAGGESTVTVFTVSKDIAGTYKVEANGLTGSFVVKAPPPPPKPAEFRVTELSISPVEVKPRETVTITVKVTNTGEETGS